MTRPPVSAVRVYLRLYGWIFLVPLAFALVFAWFQRMDAEKARLLAEYGVDSVATVTGKYAVSHGSAPGQPGSYSYYVKYRFQADGQAVEAEQAVYKALFDSVAEGDEIPVRYVRTDPDLSEVEPLVTESIWSLPGLLASGFGLLSLVSLFWRGRLIGSALRAARLGEVREATVTGHERSAIVVGGTRLQRLTWKDNRSVKGSSRPRRPQHLAAYPVGSKITVLADPDSDRVWWAGDLVWWI